MVLNYILVGFPWLDCSLDTDVDYTSNEAGSSLTYYPLFSSVLFILLFTTLIYKTPIMYFERRWQSNFEVSILVTCFSIR